MGLQRNDGWEVGTLYSQDQVEAVLREIGLRVNDYESTDFRLYCPFHGNTDTPTFRVSTESGLFHCFNPACAKSGTLVELVMKFSGGNPFTAARLISKNKTQAGTSIEDRIAAELEEPVEWVAFDQEVLNRCYEDFWSHERANSYMRNRKFEDETLHHFRIGYSAKQDQIMVPMHNPEGLPIGVIGRSVEGKDFKNSTGLPRRKVPWNYHRAKRQGDTVIICEASFDAMRIHQAGYPNVIALLGGSLSQEQRRLIARTFNTIVVMTDWDDPKKHIYKACQQCKREGSKLCKGHNPGESLGLSITNQFRDKRVLWGHCGEKNRFPEGCKDAGDMSDTQIRHVISNAISSLEYLLDA